MATAPKTVPTAAGVADFVAAQTGAGRQTDCREIVQVMQRACGEPACMWGAGIVGFGTYRLAHAGGRSADWPLIAFAPRKSELTLYLSHDFEAYEGLMARLGTFKTGKGCLYIRRLGGIDREVLAGLIDGAVAARDPSRVRPGVVA